MQTGSHKIVTGCQYTVGSVVSSTVVTMRGITRELDSSGDHFMSDIDV